MRTGCQKSATTVSPNTAVRRPSWCEASPYNSAEESWSQTVKLQQKRPASKAKSRHSAASNRSMSPPFPARAAASTDASKKPATASFKKALSLLVQPNKQETAEFLAQFNSLRLYHRLLEPEIRPVSVVTTGRLREKALWARHHRRNSFHDLDSKSDMSQLAEENEQLRAQVRELTFELHSARQVIAVLQRQCEEREANANEKPRRLSLPGDLKRNVPVPKLALPQREMKGFHEEFMENLPYFSKSWRDAIPDAK